AQRTREGNMLTFDLRVLEFFQSFVHRSETFDAVVVFVCQNSLVKGGMLMAALWWLWFVKDKPSEEREYVVFGFGISIVSVFVARFLAIVLPFRERPLHDPLLHFQLPFTMDPSSLEGWSSFPSDHAVVFSCLAVVLWFVSRPLGIAA